MVLEGLGERGMGAVVWMRRLDESLVFHHS